MSTGAGRPSEVMARKNASKVASAPAEMLKHTDGNFARSSGCSGCSPPWGGPWWSPGRLIALRETSTTVPPRVSRSQYTYAPCLTQSIYVVLAEFDQVLIDRLAISGWKVVQGRVTTLRLWLQLWDAQTGRLLWESAGEATVASELLRPERTVPLHGIARKLWLRMIREGLLDRRSQ